MNTEMSTSLKVAEKNFPKQETVREQWNDQFQKSHTHVARYIANQLAKEILTTTNDPFIMSPTRFAPKYHFTSFNVDDPKDLKRIVELLGKSVAMTPFRDWAERFQKEASQCEQTKDNDSVKSNLDVNYFQPKIIAVAKLAVENLREQLLEHTKKDNTFKFMVKWFDKEESLFDWFATVKTNYMGVVTWIEKPILAEPQITPKDSNQNQTEEFSLLKKIQEIFQ